MTQAKPKSVFGNFSDTPYITTDPDANKTDPYIKKDLIPSRYLGKSLGVKAPVSGRLPDTYFEKKFLTLSSKEQNNNKDIDAYEDPGRADRRAVQEAKKKNIVDKDFKVASYPKKTTGAGSFVGCFQDKPFEHQPEYKVLAKDEAPPRPKPQLTNIKTNPPKKGTFGFVGTLIEKPQPYDPNKKSDEFDALRKRDRELWEASKKKNIAGTFKLTGLGKKMFDEKPGTGISSVYDHYEPKEDPKKRSKKKEKPPVEAKPVDSKPFRFTSPAKSGEQGYLGKFANSRTETQQDPYDSAKLKRKEEKEKAPKPLGGTWKPVSNTKKSVISSLLRRFY